MFEQTLYGLDKKGAFKVWTVEVKQYIDPVTNLDTVSLTVRHGSEGGVMTPKQDFNLPGKQGRNSYEQSVFEARAKIKKQMDKNYRATKEELTELPILPMLAEDFNKAGHRIKWEGGVDISDKMDGMRAKVTGVDGGVEITSRTGQLKSIPHIAAELNKGMEDAEILDGEIYFHGAILQDIISAVNREDTQKEIDKVLRAIKKHGEDYRRPSKVRGIENPTLAEELKHAEYIHWLRPRLKFVAFDKPSKLSWFARLEDLNDYMRERFTDNAFVSVIAYTRVYDEAAVKILHADAVQRGFEGVMLRNRFGLYESGKRSADLQKYKVMISGEFLILDLVADKQGNGVYVCQNDINTRPFNVVYGSMAERLSALNSKDVIISSYLTVDYQTRYKDTLLPQFGVGKGVRAGEFVDGEFVPSE